MPRYRLAGANITNELLVQQRYEEAAALAGARSDGAKPHLRTHAMLCHNRALALVRLGRVDEARVEARSMLRALPGAAHMIIDLFALAALDGGDVRTAAWMAGWSAQFNRERDRYSDAPEAAVIADTQRVLLDLLGPDCLADWMKEGAAMSLNDLLSRALPSA